jgi:prepilin-type processing-associated H-X9-DG protein
MAARSIACLSNIRQLSNATLMWANDHKGYMPAGGGNTPYRWDPLSNTIVADGGNDTDEVRKENQADWICWARRLDAFSGATPSVSDQNITYSALAKYLGYPRRDHQTADQANTIAPKLEAVYRCPEDNLLSRGSQGDSSHGAYRYSYAMNSLYCNPVKAGTGRRVDGVFNGKINTINHPSEKILYVCEDEKTLTSGTYSANPSKWTDPTATMDLVAARHDSDKKRTTYGFANSSNLNAQGHDDCRGNIGFCDGHAERFGRKDALRGRYTGSAAADPTGF